MDPERGARGSRQDGRNGQGERDGAAGAELAGVGLQFALVILGFALGGYELDKHLGTSPWFLITLIFVGAAAGFYSMYRQVMAVQRRNERRGDGGPAK